MARRYVLGILPLVCWLFAATHARAFNPLDPNNTCDYIVLTANSLITQADRLVSHRSGEHRTCRVTLSEVQSAFPGANDAEKIRNFVLEAYQNWKVAPTYLLLLGDADHTTPGTGYDLLPSYYEWNEYYIEDGNRWFANDGYFVESPYAGDEKPIMYLGRIPARTTAQAANAIDKILYYDAITGSPAWLGRILMLVGDANINHANGIYRTLNDQIKNGELGQWSPLATIYSSDYDISEWPENVTADTRDRFNTGYGFVNAFGNTWGMNHLVLSAHFNLFGSPTFTESLNAGNNMFPVVFAGSCLVNYFYRNFQSSIGEDLLLKAPDRGAVAVIAATHVNEITESYEVDRYFVHEMVHEGVANVGRLFTSAKSQFFLQDLGYEIFGKQYTLLGDPGLNIKLHPLLTPDKFVNSVEVEDAPVFQDVVLESSTSGLTNPNLRIVHSDGGVAPLLSERMLRATLTDGTGAPYIEWKLQDLNVPIVNNMILSFWMNIPESPSGNGKIVLDGNTTAGRLKDNFNIFDQNGVRLNAEERTPLGPGWQFIYADLSALQGQTLLDLRLRYGTTIGAEAGDLTAYLDDIRIEAGNWYEILNYSFEEDQDGNGTPDFWTDLWGMADTDNVLRSDNFSYYGEYSMLVYDEWCNGQGAQHVFHSSGYEDEYMINFQYMAPSVTTFRVKVIDANWGTELINEDVVAGPSWYEYFETFPNLDYQFGTGRIKIQILPLECDYPVYIDVMTVAGLEHGIVESGESFPRSVGFGGVIPNPVPRGATAQIRFDLPRSSNVEISVYNLAGRLVTRIPLAHFSAGTHELPWNPHQQRVAPGIYFMKFSVNGKPLPGSKKVAVLR